MPRGRHLPAEQVEPGNVLAGSCARVLTVSRSGNDGTVIVSTTAGQLMLASHVSVAVAG